MLKSPFEPCIPSGAKSVPARPEWIHEIKHDGYRLIVQRDDNRVRLWTRNGHDWSDRFPLISEAALRNRNSSFVLDGEAVLLGVDGRSDFNGLHSRRHDHEVEFYAFDILVSDGEDLRTRSMRKASLARLLARRVDGIFLSDFEQGEIGPDLFRHACLIGLEGVVSKHRESTYRGGRSDHWITELAKSLIARIQAVATRHGVAHNWPLVPPRGHCECRMGVFVNLRCFSTDR
jgi:bifunctional non-homologous end joining protein LigD